MIVLGKYAYGAVHPEMDRTENNDENHRSINTNEIVKDYILVCGCSQSWGIGVEKENTYASILMRMLSVPVYNISIPGSGCDLINFNVLKWLVNFPIKPKFVVIQWSDFDTRMYAKHKDFGIVVLGPWIFGNYSKHLYNKKSRALYKNSLGSLGERSIKRVENLRSVLEKLGIDYYDFTLKRGLDMVNHIEKVDAAKDVVHIGDLTHMKIANTINEKIRGI